MGQYKFETLFSTKWLEIRRALMGDRGEYIYSHSPWSNGNGVAVLPFKGTSGGVEFLGRFEICPAHSDEPELCSITGGCDKRGELPTFTAMRELIEEGGYEVHQSAVIPLGTLRGSKSSDSTTYLYAVDLDTPGTKKTVAMGDGTLGEVGSYCAFVSAEDLVKCKDPYIHAMMLRLDFILSGHQL